MRLFTHHLHNPAHDRSMAPPASMWRELRERLDRLSKSPAPERRLRVNGVVEVAENDVSCALCVVVNGRMQGLRDVGSNGRFRLDLPAAEDVRLVFIQFGYLPRVVEIRPSREHAENPQRLKLRVSLTRSVVVGGARLSPLRERITLGHGHGPVVVEYDREPRTARHEDFWPLLKRAS